MLEIFAHFLLIFSFLLFVKSISDGKINLKILLFSASPCSLGLMTKFYEVVALVPLVMLVVYLGVYPKPILEPVDKSVKQLVQVMYLKSVTPEAKAQIASVNTIGETK